MPDFASLRVGFAFVAGVVTFFAPCSYPLLPGYIAYYLGQPDGEAGAVTTRLRRAGVVGIITSLGFFFVYAVLAGIVVAIGSQALTKISVLELVVGSLLVILGGAMALGWIDPAVFHVRLPKRRRSPTGFFLFGIVYAAAAAGCTAPLFIGVATFGLAEGPIGAMVTLGAYAAGMSVLMIAVTTLAAIGKNLGHRRIARHSGWVSRGAGVLLVAAGLAQMYLFVVRFEGLRLLGLT